MTVIKVQLVIATLEVGGAEKQLCALATRLDRARFAPHVIALTRGGPLEDELAAAGVPYRILGKRTKVGARTVVRLARHLRRERPDVLHTWLFTGNSVGRVAGLLARCPVIVASERTTHTSGTAPYVWTDRILGQFTDVTVVNSEGVREAVLGRGAASAGATRVVHNGLDVTRFQVPHVPGDPGVLRLISVGNLKAEKRIDLIVAAARTLVDAGVRVAVCVHGEGELRSELEAQIADLGLADTVRLPGATDDVPAALARGDVFVLSSDIEGLPNAVLEAMAAGVPVVATRAGGTAEIVTDGQDGLLVDVGDLEGLVRGVSMLVDPEHRRRIGAAGQRRAADFGMEAMVARYETLYEELVNAR